MAISGEGTGEARPAATRVTPRYSLFTPKTLKILAAVTLVLLAAGAAIGSDNDVLWTLDDVVFFALILSVLALIVLTVGTLREVAHDLAKRVHAADWPI
ncbi:MAG: hypothetical protein JW895_00880 [Thermoleophilaceae bacterium]|nr:hypothetical protein [Thermoleophilaceae bacterium]